MPTLLIPPAATNLITARWLAKRIARALWHLGLIQNRTEADRALSRDGLPSLMVSIPDPGAPHGKREFLITVEEQK